MLGRLRARRQWQVLHLAQRKEVKGLTNVIGGEARKTIQTIVTCRLVCML